MKGANVGHVRWRATLNGEQYVPYRRNLFFFFFFLLHSRNNAVTVIAMSHCVSAINHLTLIDPWDPSIQNRTRVPRAAPRVFYIGIYSVNLSRASSKRCDVTRNITRGHTVRPV